MDKRQENIDKLENLAQEVLKLKNLHRQSTLLLWGTVGYSAGI